MEDNKASENLIANRILLAGAMVFIVMPFVLLILDSLGFESGTSNPRLAIGVISIGAFTADQVYMHIKKKGKQQ